MAEDPNTPHDHATDPKESGLDSATPTPRKASSIALLAAVVVLVLIVAGGVWWYAAGQQAAEEIEAANRLQSLGAFVNPMPKEGRDRHAKTVNLSLPDAHDNIDAIVAELPALPYLASLNARNAPITNEHLAVIGQLDSLLDLDLTYITEDLDSQQSQADDPGSQENEREAGPSQVTDAGMPHLTGLGNLTKLELYGTQVSEKGLEAVARLETLKILNIGSTNAKGDLSELLPLKNLEWLVAGDLVLSDDTVDTFVALPKLAKLTIHGAKISDEALDELRERKPGLMIDLSRRQ